jgi:hypothetical protein
MTNYDLELLHFAHFIHVIIGGARDGIKGSSANSWCEEQ